MVMNSELPQIPSTMVKKDFIRGFAQRLKGKYGRFRGNLSGRRVNFSGRTVISPNPNLKIDEVSIPLLVAKILTYKDRVTDHNIIKLRKMILNTGRVHPGAKFVTLMDTGETKAVQYSRRDDILSRLRVGDLVERELTEGDYVLFNRQPSLHRLSILCMRVRLSDSRTFSFNECVCTPFNADFDGDEMNIHVPQTEEARAEAAVLMNPKRNLVTPCNGQLVIGATQDFLSGIYLLTDKERFFNRREACQLIHSMMIADVQLPPAAIVKPVELWSGKQIFGVLLAPTPECKSDPRMCCNLRCPSKRYRGQAEDMSADDSYVVIRNSELICGQIDKSLIGSGGSKMNVLYCILRDNSADYCAEVMWRISRISVAFLLFRGLSLGLSDVNAPAVLLDARTEILKSGFDFCEDKNQKFATGQFDCTIGCDEAESLESTLNSKLSELRNSIGSECLRYLPSTNAPRIMSLSGSKGSAINVCQMITCVGQQTVSGGRIREDRYQARCLSAFNERSRDPAAYGFIEKSFRSGLEPHHFFYHAMAGREGLVDTAVKTAETGYMQRRLVKCLEDLTCAYDGTVRSANADLVQFRYGSDGLDPCNIETPMNDHAFDVARVYDNCTARTRPSGPWLTAGEVRAAADAAFHSPRFASEFDADRVGELAAFVDERAGEMGSNYARRITEPQLRDFLEECLRKQIGCKVEPGTPVGALCAQSVGEPCTQMTLKTFHFAGVASMNITLGVPRIKELVNAVKAVKTPVITIPMMHGATVEDGERIRDLIECVRLKQVTKGPMKLVCSSDDLALFVQLTTQGAANRVCEAIRAQSRRLKMKNVRLSTVKKEAKGGGGLMGPDVVIVRPPHADNLSLGLMTTYASRLPSVIVGGIATIKRVFVSQEDPEQQVMVLAEGSGLAEVMTIRGVDTTKAKTNDILETARVLGIEAARHTIFSEINETMMSHGISVDRRHIMLLVDTMTNRGEVMGLTRGGLAKMKESPLMLASFEQTIEHLYDAGYYGQTDDLVGISERVITGLPIRAGTGTFDILHQTHKSDACEWDYDPNNTLICPDDDDDD